MTEPDVIERPVDATGVNGDEPESQGRATAHERPSAPSHDRLASTRRLLHAAEAVLLPTRLQASPRDLVTAAGLLRLAAGWALSASEQGPADHDLRKLCERRAGDLREREIVALGRTHTDDEQASVEQLRGDIVALEELCLRELAAAGEAARAAQVRMAKQALLAAGGLSLIALVVMAVVAALSPTDLAKGKSFKTSSRYAGFDPEVPYVDGVPARILFHTALDETPWVTYDLGAVTEIDGLRVKNRSEFSDRAVPLVVEVSNDNKSFREVARRTANFDVWKPRFSRQSARYVRLRVTKSSFLHLESVSIYRENGAR